MPARHDHDASGPAAVLAAKAELRDRIWSRLREHRVARFPGAVGRIPNFVGAERAAERLRETEAWQRAATLKSNPDSPQLPVRQRALEDNKLVYMAVPRLAEAEPFFVLDPDRLADTPRKSASIKGASRSAQRVAVAELEPVDLVVTGCVAVTEDGARLGKGGGFSDLEYALASEAGLIGDETIVATTVHELQVVQQGHIPTVAHDVWLDLIVTEERVIRCPKRKRTRARIRWDELNEDKIAAIPLLAAMRT
jgi:5-formyltetrahydrofolate cyclo-ligase